MKPRIFWTLFCEFVLILFQFFDLSPPLLGSSQLVSILLTTLSTALKDSHLCAHVLSSSQLFTVFFISFNLLSTLVNWPNSFNLSVISTAKLLKTRTAKKHLNMLETNLPFEHDSAQRSFHTEIFHREAFYTEVCYAKKLLHREGFTQSELLNRRLVKQRNSCTEKLLHRETFTHISFYTLQLFPQRNLHTQQARTHRETFAIALMQRCSWSFAERSFQEHANWT